MTERLWKPLGTNRKPHHGCNGRWARVGEWMPAVKGDLVLRRNGYHLCRDGDLVQWLRPELYIAECRGERTDSDDKIVVREARLVRRVEVWNERTARLFACDCAEHVVHLTNDDRVAAAIQVARRFALGDATEEELAAARAAAVAAGAAAWAAIRVAWVARAAVVAAGAAAWAAVRAAWVARAAAVAAAVAAAGVAERKWQTTKLLEYLSK